MEEKKQELERRKAAVTGGGPPPPPPSTAQPPQPPLPPTTDIPLPPAPQQPPPPKSILKTKSILKNPVVSSPSTTTAKSILKNPVVVSSASSSVASIGGGLKTTEAKPAPNSLLSEIMETKKRIGSEEHKPVFLPKPIEEPKSVNVIPKPVEAPALKPVEKVAKPSEAPKLVEAPKPVELPKPEVVVPAVPNLALHRLMQKEKEKTKEPEKKPEENPAPAVTLPDPLQQLLSGASFDKLKTIVASVKAKEPEPKEVIPEPATKTQEDVDELEAAMNDPGGIPQSFKDRIKADLDDSLEEWQMETTTDDLAETPGDKIDKVDEVSEVVDKPKEVELKEKPAESKKRPHLLSEDEDDRLEIDFSVVNPHGDVDYRQSAVPPAWPAAFGPPPGVNPPIVKPPAVNPPAVNLPGLNLPPVNLQGVQPPGINPPAPNPATTPAAAPFVDRSASFAKKTYPVESPKKKARFEALIHDTPSSLDTIPGLGSDSPNPRDARDSEVVSSETDLDTSTSESKPKKRKVCTEETESEDKKELKSMSAEELAALAAKQLGESDSATSQDKNTATTSEDIEDEGLIVDSSDEEDKKHHDKKSRSRSPGGRRRRRKRSRSRDRKRSRRSRSR